jgi:hypothetical protein
MAKVTWCPQGSHAPDKVTWAAAKARATDHPPPTQPPLLHPAAVGSRLNGTYYHSSRAQLIHGTHSLSWPSRKYPQMSIGILARKCPESVHNAQKVSTEVSWPTPCPHLIHPHQHRAPTAARHGSQPPLTPLLLMPLPDHCVFGASSAPHPQPSH